MSHPLEVGGAVAPRAAAESYATSWRGRLSRLSTALATLVFVGGMIYFSLGNPQPSSHVSPSVSPSATSSPASQRRKEDLLSVAGKTIIQSKKGRLWMMEVLRVVWNDGQQKARVEDVDWTLTDLAGKKLLRVQAPAAYYLLEKNRIEFDGVVVATRYYRKDKIISNHLVWDGKKSKFIGTEGIRWEKGGMVVTGDRMESPDTLERVHLEGNVRAHGVIAEGEIPQ